MIAKQYWHVAKELFITDWKVFKQLLKDKMIDQSIWVACSIFVNVYLLPKMGMSSAFGMISFAGMLASAGIFEGYMSIVTLVGDLKSDKIIYYYATLPLPAWLMMARFMVSHASLYALLSIMYLPLGKLLMINTFDLGMVNWPQLVLITLLASLFYGAFSLMTASFVQSFEHLGSVWARFIFPLWFLGGFVFSWQMLYQTAPLFAYLNLLNPIMYISESYRVALMGQAGYLNFWFCSGMIIFLSVASALTGIRRLKKRCDFI